MNKMNIILSKNNNEIYNKNIDYYYDNDKILFNDEEFDCYIINNDNIFELNRDNKDYCFNLVISSENKSFIHLKEQDIKFDIKVESAEIIKNDKKIIINYQLETEDMITTIEINL